MFRLSASTGRVLRTRPLTNLLGGQVMDRGEATLIAALVAASASVLKLILDHYSEGRANQRELLQPLLTELGEAIYGIVATSVVMSKTKSDEAFTNASGKAEEEQRKLKALRPKLRYPLWGVDEGVRVLTRLPDWVSHARSNPKKLQKLLDQADALRSAIDKVAIGCYKAGRTPTKLESWRVRFQAWRCRRTYNGGSNG